MFVKYYLKSRPFIYNNDMKLPADSILSYFKGFIARGPALGIVEAAHINPKLLVTSYSHPGRDKGHSYKIQTVQDILGDS